MLYGHSFDSIGTSLSLAEQRPCYSQADATKVREQLRIQEAEAVARRKQQESQQLGIWRDLVKCIRPQQTAPEGTALISARDKEQRVQEIVGPPPEPPVAPKGTSW